MSTPFRKSIYELKTCIIHRETLINDEICFRCCKESHDEELKTRIRYENIFKQQLDQCFFCLIPISVKEVFCENCFRCSLCRRYSHFVGFCTFCYQIFNLKILKTSVVKWPIWFLKSLVYPNWQFLQELPDTKTIWCSKDIARLILAYIQTKE